MVIKRSKLWKVDGFSYTLSSKKKKSGNVYSFVETELAALSLEQPFPGNGDRLTDSTLVILYWLSIAVIKYLRQSTCYKKDLLWFSISEGTRDGCLVLMLWPVAVKFNMGKVHVGPG